jgi:hypothetical protein
VLGGSASVSGYGSQGPAGNNISFIIDRETGCTVFEDYTHVTFTSSSDIPSSLHGTTLRLKNGVGRYNFAMGTFSDLQFNVQVQDSSGKITSSPHSFSGSTTPPLSVPVGGNPPTGVNLKLYLSSPSSINLGGGSHGNVSIDSSELITATDL